MINLFISWEEWDHNNPEVGVCRIGNNIFTLEHTIRNPEDLIELERRIQEKHGLESQPFIRNFIELKPETCKTT